MSTGLGERTAELVHEGDYWTVAFEGRDLRVRDSKGMRYLAALLSRPGVEIAALELAGGRSAERVSPGQAAEHGLEPTSDSDLGPVLDDGAKRAFRQRLQELRAEQDEAEAFHDLERAARARAEYEFVADELASAVGMGGRDRRAGSPAERARLNVTRAIKTSIERLAEHDSALGEFLTNTVLTGRACVYRPERAAPVHWRVITRAPRAAGQRRFEPPDTHYTEVDGVNVAYQVLGAGPVDLVFRTGWLSHLDFQWTDPTYTRLLRNLAGFSRLIMYDKRGIGLSDPVRGTPTLEEHIDDIRGVMDAVGSQRVVLFGVYEAAAIFAAFAATYPERTRALVAYGAAPAGPGVSDFPGRAELGEMTERLKVAVDTWGRGASLAVLAPDLAGNRLMRRLWGTFERASMSPAVARSQLEWINQLDIRPALPAISVPTLVVHCTGDVMPIESGRYVASIIPGARFAELPGDWHLPLTGDMDLLVETIEEFVGSAAPRTPPDRLLATVLVVESAGGPQMLGDDYIRERIVLAGGIGIDLADGRVTARFDGPARAIRCAQAVLEDAGARGDELSAGLHTGECKLTPDGVRGAPFSIAAGLTAQARPGDVLVTATVRDLVGGSGIDFAPRGTQQIAGVQGEWLIFAATSNTVETEIVAATTERIPLFDRAAHGVARRAPALSRSTLRLVKGGK